MGDNTIYFSNINLNFLEEVCRNRSPTFSRNLEFLLIYNENNAIVGSTNMTDVFWSSVLWHYSDFSDFTSEKPNITEQVANGINAGVYLQQNKLAIAMDDGSVNIYEISYGSKKQWQGFNCLKNSLQHNDSILTISSSYDKKNIVTGAMDYAIKVWDVEDLTIMHSYDSAHTDIVSSVDTSPSSASIFASCALDGEASLWDVRQSTPAQCILKKYDAQLSSVAWNTNLEHLLAIGADNGNITLIDIRQLGNNPLHEGVKFERSIHKLLFNPNPEKKEQLVGCCNDVSVKIFDSDKEMSLIYENNDHNDFVRGIAWNKDAVLSCSWDGRIIKHVIPPSNNE